MPLFGSVWNVCVRCALGVAGLGGGLGGGSRVLRVDGFRGSGVQGFRG